MTADANKGITNISYNHLNLPTNISINGGNIQYIYTATGRKQRKVAAGTTTDYAGNYIYKNGSLEFFSHPEGYVDYESGSYDYVYNYKDIWRNVRLSYSDLDGNGSIDSNTEILKERNYYPFGLTHRGYNGSVIGAENNYKTYQSQELTKDLGLNVHEWRYRISDPSIGRFWQVDPLASQYPYNSVYAFQENKLGLGVELEGLELKRLRGGFQEFISGVSKTVTQYFNDNGYGTREGVAFRPAENMSPRESIANYAEGARQISNGTTEMVKGGTKTVGSGLEVSGDAVTGAGIVTGQPGIVATGEVIGGVGTTMNAAVDISDGKPIENVAIEAAVTIGFGKLGKEGVQAVRKVAGEEAVKSGANKVSESIIQGTVGMYEKLFENYVTPKLQETTVPVFEPVQN